MMPLVVPGRTRSSGHGKERCERPVERRGGGGRGTYPLASWHLMSAFSGPRVGVQAPCLHIEGKKEGRREGSREGREGGSAPFKDAGLSRGGIITCTAGNE